MITVPIKQISKNEVKWFESKYAEIKKVVDNDSKVKALENEVETRLLKLYQLTYEEVLTVCPAYWLSKPEYENFQLQ